METEKADLFWITLAKCRRHHKRLKSRPINVENDMATQLIFREISWETPKDGARFQEGIFREYVFLYFVKTVSRNIIR